jgi:hypothetical protein
MGGWNKPCAGRSTLGFPGSIVSFRRAVWIFIIMIGTDLTTPPSHTTAHTVPYTAVRTVMLFSNRGMATIQVCPFGRMASASVFIADAILPKGY